MDPLGIIALLGPEGPRGPMIPQIMRPPWALRGGGPHQPPSTLLTTVFLTHGIKIPDVNLDIPP